MKTWEKIWKLVCGMIKRSSFERYNTTSDIENLSIKLESYHRKALEIVATKKSRSFDKFLEFYIAALYDLEAQELNQETDGNYVL